MRYIGTIILLVLCLTLLLLTGCVVNTVIPETTIGNLENQEDINQSSNNSQSSSTGSVEEPAEPIAELSEEPVIENTEEPVMWFGLGMALFSTNNTSEFDSYVDDLLANGFNELRVDIPAWNDEYDGVARSKAAVIRAIAKGANIIWGVGQSKNTITAANWPDFRAAILSAAQWAQDNGVYEFQLGNEEEFHVDETTMTIEEIITNLKSVATDVQEIFTNGNVSYSCWQNTIDDWVVAGKGDIDILASNVYMGGNGSYSEIWKTRITNLVNAFGADGTYITEFAPSYSFLDDYSTDEAVQATAITEMIDYIKASGMTRAFYFCYTDPFWESGDLFGARKDDGTYRLLWSQALLNTGSVKSTTVPTKTTTISLPDTIALIPK
jgi:hypothetical protein